MNRGARHELARKIGAIIEGRGLTQAKVTLSMRCSSDQ